MFFSKKMLLKTILTGAFNARDELERLSNWEPIFILPLTGKQKSFRVAKSGNNGEDIVIGGLSADFSKMLLTSYPNCKYNIKSHKIIYCNGYPACEVVVRVLK